MRTFAALLLVVACSKHSQHELGKAADDVNQAAHEAAHAVASSAQDDVDELSRELHDVEGKLAVKTDEAARATDETARKTASDAATALEHERDELKAKLAAARAAHAGSSSP
jgi:hypothetical protein